MEAKNHKFFIACKTPPLDFFPEQYKIKVI